jgi:hypothetical protein
VLRIVFSRQSELWRRRRNWSVSDERPQRWTRWLLYVEKTRMGRGSRQWTLGSLFSRSGGSCRYEGAFRYAGNRLCEKNAHKNCQTFESFSSLPLLEIIKSEIRTLGSLTFFSSGVLGRVATLPLTFCRQGLVEIAVDSVLRKLTNGAENAVSRRRYATRAHFVCRMLVFSLPFPPLELTYIPELTSAFSPLLHQY